MKQYLLEKLKSSDITVHAIYPPEESETKWYLAAVEMFGLTFRVYFSSLENEITIEHIEEWKIG